MGTVEHILNKSNAASCYGKWLACDLISVL